MAQLTVGQRIARFRADRAGALGRRRYTQRELAEDVGVAKSTVAAWEGDAQAPMGDNLVALARALGRTPEEVLGSEAAAGEAAGQVREPAASYEAERRPSTEKRAAAYDVIEGIVRLTSAGADEIDPNVRAEVVKATRALAEDLEARGRRRAGG